MAILLKNDFNKAVKIKYSFKYSLRVLNILCNKIGSMHEALLLITKVQWLSQEKILMQLFKLQVKLATVFMEY